MVFPETTRQRKQYLTPFAWDLTRHEISKFDRNKLRKRHFTECLYLILYINFIPIGRDFGK